MVGYTTALPRVRYVNSVYVYVKCPKFHVILCIDSVLANLNKSFIFECNNHEKLLYLAFIFDSCKIFLIALYIYIDIYLFIEWVWLPQAGLG